MLRDGHARLYDALFAALRRSKPPSGPPATRTAVCGSVATRPDTVGCWFVTIFVTPNGTVDQTGSSSFAVPTVP